MNLKLKNTPEQIELIKAMGSRNQLVSREAQEAFAAFLGPVIQKVLMNAGSAGAIFSDAEFDEDDSPSYPLDLYYNEGAGYVSVWSQHMAGGLPSSEVTGVSELKISTYRLDSAVSFNKRYARRSRLDVISKAVERMANEVLIKQERNAWAVILKALAEGSTNESSFASGVHSDSANKHVWHTGAGKSFSLHQLNLLLRKHKRMNEGFAGMTPIAPYSSGLTDLFVSPEIMSDIRAFAYNPLKTSVSDPSVGGGQHLTDGVRDGIWSSGGMSEIFGININELIELGVNKKYNDLFDTMAASTQYADLDGVATNLTFAAADELIVGIDKAGFYGSMEEGRVCLDARAIAGLVLDAS